MKLVKSKSLGKILFATVLGLSSLNVLAANNIVVNTPITVSPLPASLTYGNSFTGLSTGVTFFDDYIFTIADGSANSVTSSINLDSIFQLSDLSARLYTGSTHYTGLAVPGTLMEVWGTVANFSPTVSATTVVLNPLSLSAGTYTLQIKGIVTGLYGGSYAGVLNIAPPVPEPETYAMLLAGLGLIGFISRRRNKA